MADFVREGEHRQRPLSPGTYVSFGAWGWSFDDLRTTPHLVAAFQADQVKLRSRDEPFRKGQLVQLVRLIISDGALLACGLAHPDIRNFRADVAEVARSLQGARKFLGMSLSLNVDASDLKETFASIERLRTELDQVEAMLPAVRQAKPDGGRDVLLREYVRQVGIRWCSVFETPPTSASGPYQRILTAGWRDLKWPGHDIGEQLGAMIGNEIVKASKRKDKQNQ